VALQTGNKGGERECIQRKRGKRTKPTFLLSKSTAERGPIALTQMPVWCAEKGGPWNGAKGEGEQRKRPFERKNGWLNSKTLPLGVKHIPVKEKREVLRLGEPHGGKTSLIWGLV